MTEAANVSRTIATVVPGFIKTSRTKKLRHQAYDETRVAARCDRSPVSKDAFHSSHFMRARAIRGRPFAAAFQETAYPKARFETGEYATKNACSVQTIGRSKPVRLTIDSRILTPALPRDARSIDGHGGLHGGLMPLRLSRISAM